MPKETFYNLPEEKRNRICEAAIREFANFDFDLASINRIVTESGISKGSFYQYFEDKLDVYKYMFGLMAESKKKRMHLNDNPDELFSFIEHLKLLYKESLLFAVENPDYTQIASRLLKNKNSETYTLIYGDTGQLGKAYFNGLIERGIKNGELRTDIDIPFVSHLLVSLNETMLSYVQSIAGEMFIEHLDKQIDQLLKFILNGIADNKERSLT